MSIITFWYCGFPYRVDFTGTIEIDSTPDTLYLRGVSTDAKLSVSIDKSEMDHHLDTVKRVRDRMRGWGVLD